MDVSARSPHRFRLGPGGTSTTTPALPQWRPTSWGVAASLASVDACSNLAASASWPRPVHLLGSGRGRNCRFAQARCRESDRRSTRTTGILRTSVELGSGCAYLDTAVDLARTTAARPLSAVSPPPASPSACLCVRGCLCSRWASLF